ncbi:hypothetical protein [Kineococcus sp. R86509]|uniref:hypothetical protein n=1 Tax=Kineococcus sp. R86509 TaxID=3093851 RepID=UPI0036D2D9C0
MTRLAPDEDRTVKATEKELRRLKAEELSPILTAAARALAETIDATTAARDTAALVRELRAVLADLRERQETRLFPDSDLDRLREQRAARRLLAARENHMDGAQAPQKEGA